MPLTYTGRNVKPNDPVYPSLVDIAVGLSRQPRFAGQGRQWFSVLDHSLFVDEIASALPLVDLPVLYFGIGHAIIEPDGARRLLRLAVLLHDAHEAVTADVPTTFKGDELKREQERLDERILGAYFPGGYEAYAHPNLKNVVRHIDRRALAAEARVIGPSVEPERILHAFGVTDDTPDDVALLEQMLFGAYKIGIPPTKHGQEDHPAVQAYLRRVIELM